MNTAKIIKKYAENLYLGRKRHRPQAEIIVDTTGNIAEKEVLKALQKLKDKGLDVEFGHFDGYRYGT